MAKSARSRIVKENNRKLKKNVFGPAEAARLERLSAKLIALATAPKPEKDVEMNEGMIFTFDCYYYWRLKSHYLLQSLRMKLRKLLRRRKRRTVSLYHGRELDIGIDPT